MVRDRPLTRLFVTTAGLIAWAVQFTVIYAVAAVACARGYSTVAFFGIGLVPLTILAATILALAATALVSLHALRQRRRMDATAHPTDRFLNTTTLFVGGLSMITILWHGLPALIVPACT